MRPSGAHGAASMVVLPLSSSTTRFNSENFPTYGPTSAAAEEQLYARIVSVFRQGGFNVVSYGWIQV